MFENDTIIAAATPKGAGALAILRISGPNACDFFAKMIAETEKFAAAKLFTTKLYTVKHGAEVLDEVMAIKYESPKSFTGEQMVEITCHGGTIIVERLIQFALELGMRYAGRGEFSQRAFLNGKVDLKKAESINRIIHAETVTAHRSAVRHYLGEERQFFDSMRADLIKMMVALETEIEFSETDDVGEEAAFTAQIATLLDRMKGDLSAELHKRDVLHQLDKGVSVAIVGRANAGKSSIMNMLLGYNRAIINSRAGTTRDLITESCVIEDLKVQFVDTAGLNETTDEIELEGIRRTRGAINEAEMILWVVDGSQEFPKTDFNLIPRDKPLFGVVNKCDLGENSAAKSIFEGHQIPVIAVSALMNEGRDAIIEAVTAVLREKFSDMEYETAIGSEREAGIIRRMLAEIAEVDLAYPPEIVAESIRSLVNGFDEIYGKNSPDDILNKLFSDFCIGK